MRRSRKEYIVALGTAALLGLSGLVPGSEHLAATFGIAEARAQKELVCPNTNCLGSADCNYLESHTCRLGNSECSVRNC